MTTPLLLTVFSASVAGSLHCVGMCGPLMACATSTGQTATTNTQPATLGPGFGKQPALQRFAPHLAYHTTRGLGYITLGAAAGSLGALLDLTSTLTGLMPLAGFLAGAMLVVIALATVTKAMGWTLRKYNPTHATPGPLKRALLTLQRKALALPPTARAAALGTLTPLLPCGWLYAFALIAAGTGSLALGAAVMLAFWLGTLPVLLALGLGLQNLLATLRQRAPKLTAWATAAALLLIGLHLFTGRLALDPTQLALAAQSQNKSQNPSQNQLPSPNDTPACCALMQAADPHPDSQPSPSP